MKKKLASLKKILIVMLCFYYRSIKMPDTPGRDDVTLDGLINSKSGIVKQPKKYKADKVNAQNHIN